MALTLVWQQADVDALKAAISSGVLIVKFDGPPGRLVQYQSIEAMRDQLARILAESGAADGRPNYKLAGFKKGL